MTEECGKSCHNRASARREQAWNSPFRKVLVLAPPLASAGGIQRYTACLVRALEDLLSKANVCCIAIPNPTEGNASGRFSAGVKLRFVWQALWESVRWKPDLIICAHLALGPIGRLLSKTRHRPYWIAVYGIEAWSSLSRMKSSALRHADRLLTISNFSRDQIIRRHATDIRRMVSLPCALDDALLGIQPAADDAGARIPDDRRVVMTVARMSRSECYKGHDVVLRALPSVLGKISNLIYAVVGEGDDRPRLEALTKELGLSQYVVFTGRVTDSELVNLYQRSEVFLLPATTVIDEHNPKGEGFGIVYLEAMAFGIPVIGPNCGAPAEFIQHQRHGLLVDSEVPESVAEALLHLLTDTEKAREMGRAASEWVRQNYSYDRFRERLRDILTACLPSEFPA